MRLTPDLIEELEALTLYQSADSQTGIKVHKNAKPSVIDAVQRLYEKGLVTQIDGGYLTQLGQDAAEHARALLSVLTSPCARL